MSSYLTFRFISDENINFYHGLKHSIFKPIPKADTVACTNADDLDRAIRLCIDREYIPGKTALLLSGGMDSAVIASYLPKGTPVYTLKCIAPGAIDETERARRYAAQYGLSHEIIEIKWDDFILFTPKIVQYNQVPVHSIEVQLYKAALYARNRGISKLLIGESADLKFGGMDKLLAKDWTFDDFVARYTFLNPAQVLTKSVSVASIYEKYRTHQLFDVLRFIDEVYAIESLTSYMHAFHMGEIDYCDPYAKTYLSAPLDLKRIRNGESKYIIRELFAKKYPDISIPDKIPLPRAMDTWLAQWTGPVRYEFKPQCAVGLTGDQKWLLYCLEVFLNVFEPQNTTRIGGRQCS